MVAAGMADCMHIGYMMAGIGVFSLMCIVLMAETPQRAINA
ncbi:hypothetical protein GCM10027418_04090 [Mariniluteicoccus endophyticus]